MRFYHHRFQFFFIALVFLAGCSGDAPLSQTTVEFEGVQFPVPKGWNNIKPDKSDYRAQISHTETLKGGEKTKNVDCVIRFQVGKPTAEKLPSAETVAKAHGGINPQDFQLDGVDAIRFEVPNKNRLFASTFHDGKGYLILGTADKNADLRTTFDEVLKTWKWTK